MESSFMMIMSLLERVLEKQDKLLETSADHTHLLSGLSTRVNEVECDIKALQDVNKKKDPDAGKAWVPVALKLLELVALVVGVLLGVQVVL